MILAKVPPLCSDYHMAPGESPSLERVPNATFLPQSRQFRTRAVRSIVVITDYDDLLTNAISAVFGRFGKHIKRKGPLIRLLPMLGAFIIFGPGCAVTRHPAVDVKRELEAMLDTDQSQRSEMEEVGTKYGHNSPEMRELWKRQQPIDDANIKRLVEIIEKNGWPARSLVGDKGATAAFLVLQHADYAYQKKYLPLVRAAVAAGEARASDLALLEDRVLMREGKKQRYGTQLKGNDKGAWELYPVEDEANVDTRRAAVGLPPLAEYLKQFGLQYPSK